MLVSALPTPAVPEGCAHVHGYEPTVRGVRANLRHHRPTIRKHRVRHFVRCTNARPAARRARTTWRVWRESPPHLYRIRFNRLAARYSWLPGHLRSIASCESHGNPHAIGGGGAYRGRYQFAFSTWGVVGGYGDPADAHPWEQDYRAALLLLNHGAGHWPVCG